MRFATSIYLLILAVASGCHRDKDNNPTVPSVGRSKSAGSRDGIPTDVPIRLMEVASSLGLNHVIHSGFEDNVYSILEVMGGGIAAGDFDADGHCDLFLTGGGGFRPEREEVYGKPCALYLQRSAQLVPAPTGICPPVIQFYSIGAHRADLNSDGWDDLLVTGYGGATQLINQGDGSFREVPLDLPDHQWEFLVAAASADLDQDGDLDLYLSNYCDWSFKHHPFCPAKESDLPREICGPVAFAGAADYMFWSDGEGGWTEANAESGFVIPQENLSKGMAILMSDWNADQKVDVYVANDGQANFLFANQGNGRFKERGVFEGVAVGLDAAPMGSMGVALGDYDNDGQQDLLVTNFVYEPIALYAGRRGGGFTYASRVSGLEELGRSYVSWGTAFVDFDLDGNQDIIIANGHVYRAPSGGSPAQPGWLLANQDGSFKDVTGAASEFWAAPHMARGVAIADFNHDLAPDIAVGILDEPAAVLENRSTERGSGLAIELIGTESARDPVGAKIVVKAQGKSWVHQWSSGGSYASSHERTLYMGFGPIDRIDTLEIQWPSGRKESHSDIKTNQRLVLVEGHGLSERPK